MDMSTAYIKSVAEQAPRAEIVFDRFHVVRLLLDAIDQVRREQQRALEGSDERKVLKKSRFSLLKNPWNLTRKEKQKLAVIQLNNRPLYRAYLLKERVNDPATLADALRRLTEGETVVDPAIVSRLLARRREADPLDRLSDREREVLALVAEGFSNAAVAARLPPPLGRALLLLADQAFVDGMHRAVFVGAFVALAGALVALVFLPSRTTAVTRRREEPRIPRAVESSALGLCKEAGLANLDCSAVVTRAEARVSMNVRSRTPVP